MTAAKRIAGTYETASAAGESVAAFVPYPLPPDKPKLLLDDEAKALLARAEQGLARLELAGAMIPSQDWFIYAFVRKEAVTSSQIEGTQATLMDLLVFEAEGHGAKKIDDVDIEEVCNYLDALKYARRELGGDKGLPLSMRLLNETHKRLMKGARGGNKRPGEIRRSQNWIGGTRPGTAAFVPPPPHALSRCLGDFEKFIHAVSDLPPLIRAGLLHVQFETIHPYLDGNGRIGRLLIILLLEHWGLLSQPLLYLSLFFKRHRGEYYRRLSEVRTQGDWEGWVAFFLEGVATVAEEAVLLARELFSLVSKDRGRVLRSESATVVAVRLFELLPLHPIVTMPGVVKLLDTTKPTAIKAMGVLEELGILVERSGRKRDKTFGYAAYLEKLRSGTELED
jgi:Fic family protein